MQYIAKGNSSCLDDIRADIARMLNLQQKIIRLDAALMSVNGTYTNAEIESFSDDYRKLSEEFADLRGKYNIKISAG